jgi:hydroxyacylglutathione hydrolase
MRIVDNLYAHIWRGNDNNCNSYIFAGALDEGRHVIIDPGHLTTPSYQEPGLNSLLTEMLKDGISSAPVGLVILTHAHPDHCEAAIALQQRHRALVATHEADEEMYRMQGGKVDIYLQEGELKLGTGGKTINLKIIHSPGHSQGHITVYWPDKKVLVAGDCVFYRSTGRTDFPGGSAESLRQSIEVLSGLDIEYLLCGHPYGHPGILKGRENVQENFDFIKRFIGN